jgi:hypothetical protein
VLAATSGEKQAQTAKGKKFRGKKFVEHGIKITLNVEVVALMGFTSIDKLSNFYLVLTIHIIFIILSIIPILLNIITYLF